MPPRIETDHWKINPEWDNADYDIVYLLCDGPTIKEQLETLVRLRRNGNDFEVIPRLKHADP